MDDALPDQVAAAWLAAMRRGDWAGAWQATDRLESERQRRQFSPGFIREPYHLRWDGTPFTGRSVLIRCEHGLGDTLQFIRFVPLIAQSAREVNLMVQPHLLPMLAGAPGLGAVHDAYTNAPAPDHEVEIEVMELAYALRVQSDAVPPPYPYLRQAVSRWPTPKLEHDTRLRVGLLWAASEWDPTRSIPVTLLAPLCNARRVRFFSLQQGDSAHDPRLDHLPIVSLSDQTAEAGAAAAAMLQLDLVISVDGFPAHLAGTLGVPTWLLLKHDADWRWMEGRSDTPWYPSMRLFRQGRAGDWEDVVTQATRALQARG